jgi:hypothetical protein
MSVRVSQRRSPTATTVTLVAGLALLWPAGTPAVEEDVWGEARTVSKDQIVRAMRQEKDQEYDLTVTANGVRLQVGIVLDLVREAEGSNPERRPLRINHEDYYEAFLEVVGLLPEQAPVFIRAAHQNREDQIVDYRAERVVARVVKGGQPRYAMNVMAGWPAQSGTPSNYSYEDKRSEPHLRVTHDRTNFYRILDFVDLILYDDIRGIRGRATSGVLGFMFNLIGDGRAVQTRLAFSSDGVQISRTTAKKMITITQTVTVLPNGQAEKGVPKDRTDLRQIADRLDQPLEVEYKPVVLSGMPAR